MKLSTANHHFVAATLFLWMFGCIHLKPLSAEELIVVPELVHLRSGNDREWSDFPEKANSKRLEIRFAASANDTEKTLRLRQQDVKQVWHVALNGKKLGELVRDENDMVITFTIPAKGMIEGSNLLTIESPPNSKVPSDDIRVGPVSIMDTSVREMLHACTITIQVEDRETKKPLPCRVTVLNADGSMQSLGAQSTRELAVRPGMVFTSTGRAEFGVPPGQYTVLAGRGFEYSLDQTTITIQKGESVARTLSIQREVPTEGLVACDTHLHTLTHSGHGDATIDERMITLAGEGIELPIACDHNKHIDYEDPALRLDVRKFFTPVMGNEVTTPRGHFNIFPIHSSASVVNHKQTDWKLLFDEIEKTPGVRVSILNHARDLHSNVRPFGPSLHIAVVGENLEGWDMRFNAMETVNSGATQSDPLQLFHDWMGLLNRGLNITPIGSSDSHDVGRHFVGQGRTYIRCPDHDPGKIDVDQAMKSMNQGRVMVSYGLLAEMTVNDRYHSGDLATGLSDHIEVHVRVLGPHWVKADRIMLFSNGTLIREESLTTAKGQDSSLPRPSRGVAGEVTWSIQKPSHDVHLVAVAMGPGIDGLHWRTARPYQPTSIEAATHVISCSGAIWLDADGDNKKSSARVYSERLIQETGDNLPKLIERLKAFDAAVSSQTAHLHFGRSTLPPVDEIHKALERAATSTQEGFRAYLDARRQCEIERANHTLNP